MHSGGVVFSLVAVAAVGAAVIATPVWHILRSSNKRKLRRLKARPQPYEDCAGATLEEARQLARDFLRLKGESREAQGKVPEPRASQRDWDVLLRSARPMSRPSDGLIRFESLQPTDNGAAPVARIAFRRAR